MSTSLETIFARLVSDYDQPMIVKQIFKENSGLDSLQICQRLRNELEYNNKGTLCFYYYCYKHNNVLAFIGLISVLCHDNYFNREEKLIIAEHMFEKSVEAGYDVGIYKYVDILQEARKDTLEERIGCEIDRKLVPLLEEIVKIDKNILPDLIDVYERLGDYENLVKISPQAKDLIDKNTTSQVNIARIQNLFQIDEDGHLSIKRYDQVFIFEEHIYSGCKDLSFEGIYGDLYKKLFASYKKKLSEEEKIKLIHAMGICLNRQFKSHLVDNNFSFFNIPCILHNVAVDLCDSLDVYFRYGICLLKYLIDDYKYEPSMLKLAEIYWKSEYTLDKKLEANPKYAKELYEKGIAGYSNESCYLDQYDPDSKTFKDLLKIFYGKHDQSASKITGNKNLSEQNKVDVLLDWMLSEDGKRTFTAFELGKKFLCNDHVSSGLHYLKVAREQGSVEAKELLQIYSVLKIKINKKEVVQPKAIDKKKYDVIYSVWSFN